ncbi:MAG: hypothetical protein QUS11_06615 [Candidatus Fermentibacter sp.]|nr:hypothetical protein [Candidatus Fermentibacter sp.]
MVVEYDRRVGRAFLALSPDQLPEEARPLLYFGQRRGEAWESLTREAAALVERVICDPIPSPIGYGAFIRLSLDVQSDREYPDPRLPPHRRTFRWHMSSVDAGHEGKMIENLLREVVPMSRAPWGKQRARELREQWQLGAMRVPGPVVTSILDMVEEGIFA